VTTTRASRRTSCRSSTGRSARAIASGRSPTATPGGTLSASATSRNYQRAISTSSWATSPSASTPS
jgi:hypothetical protein